MGHSVCGLSVCIVDIGVYMISCNIYISKVVYWKAVTFQIEYIKKYLLKGHNPSYWIYQKIPIEMS